MPRYLGHIICWCNISEAIPLIQLIGFFFHESFKLETTRYMHIHENFTYAHVYMYAYRIEYISMHACMSIPLFMRYMVEHLGMLFSMCVELVSLCISFSSFIYLSKE